MSSGVLSLSIVSHRQAGLVHDLLRDIKRLCVAAPIEVILTVNVPETLLFSPKEYPFEVVVLNNGSPRGFGANHNAAARRARSEFFCVLNPDIRFRENPFPPLLKLLADDSVGAVSARVVGPDGAMEDHARRFPRVATLLQKAFLGTLQDYPGLTGSVHSVEWIAGMFMLFRTAVFRKIGGFDERYFLYYEDVDLCTRLRAAGYDIRVEPAAWVAHDARRESRRDVRHMARHLVSMLRYLFTRPRSLPPLS
jgi:hypothetical protein